MKVTQQEQSYIEGDMTITGDVSVQPFEPIAELGLAELIGVDEQVDQYEYSGSIGAALVDVMSGEILSVALYSTEDGTGQIITEDGVLLVMDADPSVSAGDANLAAAEWPTILGKIVVDADDWFEENASSAGAMVYKTCTPIPFHELSTLYFVYYHEGATSWNDGAGDDEQLEMNAWYRRDS